MIRKVLSTFEREMKNQKFKKGYKDFLLSELLIAMMEGDEKSVRMLAKEVVAGILNGAMVYPVIL